MSDLCHHVIWHQAFKNNLVVLCRQNPFPHSQQKRKWLRRNLLSSMAYVLCNHFQHQSHFNTMGSVHGRTGVSVSPHGRGGNKANVSWLSGQQNSTHCTSGFSYTGEYVRRNIHRLHWSQWSSAIFSLAKETKYTKLTAGDTSLHTLIPVPQQKLSQGC